MSAPRSASPWLRRLPLLAFVAFGAWFWKSGFFPQPRELLWHLPDDRAGIDRVEIQIWDEKGALLKRDQFFPTASSAPELTQKVSLMAGTYDARVFVRRAGTETHVERPLVIGSDEAYSLRAW